MESLKETTNLEQKVYPELTSNDLPKLFDNFIPKNNFGKIKNWIILPDVHAPFHNEILWYKILKFIYTNKKDIEGIVITGDFLDLFSLSTYVENSLSALRDINLQLEYDSGLARLEELEVALGGALKNPIKDIKKVFLYGNHEDRFTRYVKRGDNAKFGGALKSPRTALQLDSLNYEVYENWTQDTYEIRKGLEVCHGSFIGKIPCPRALEEHLISVIFGHSHRWSSFDNGIHCAYNIGWLGNPNHEAYTYSKKTERRKWRNGFAIVNVEEGTDNYNVNPIMCDSNSFYYGGKKY